MISLGALPLLDEAGGASAEHKRSTGGVWKHLYKLKCDMHLDFSKLLDYISTLEPD